MLFSNLEQRVHRSGAILKIIEPAAPGYIPMYQQIRASFNWWIHH